MGWYFRHYFGTGEDPGTPRSFSDPANVGAFAVAVDGLRVGEEGALFRLLVATAMFQRRQDGQVLRILRGMGSADAEEVGSARQLLRLSDASPCIHTKSNQSLISGCDLTKDARGRGVCAENPQIPCHLKRHTVLLKRYGHFGKVPTSIALMIRERGGSFAALRAGVVREHRTRRARAVALEQAVSAAWRVSQKIASMFLANVTNPDLLSGATFGEGLDWSYFVVVDSNVDLFLASIGYDGSGVYDARRTFVTALARAIDLRAMTGRRVRSFNPRLVQQAMYLFMSASNRRTRVTDCSREGAVACRACPRLLRERCALRVV